VTRLISARLVVVATIGEDEGVVILSLFNVGQCSFSLALKSMTTTDLSRS
jgi:hypothetical protein